MLDIYHNKVLLLSAVTLTLVEVRPEKYRSE